MNSIQQAIEKLKYIENTAVNGMASHRDCIYGAAKEAIALLEAVPVAKQPRCAECGSDIYMSFDGTHYKCNQDFRGGCSLNGVWKLTQTQDAATTKEG